MTTLEPSNLALFWAGVIAVAILVYVILDGFDLGVGVLFGTTRQALLRSQMLAAISPFWDGNETWLVVIGASLFAAFPVVYAVFMPAFYISVLLLLLGLIFRGVAFEFRSRSARGLWDVGFFIGSTVVAFVQGAAVGTMIRGIPVVNHQYAGGSFEWLRPLPMLCGIGLVLGYALLGAGWLILKTEGALQDWAWKRIPWLAGAALAVVCVAFFVALGDRDRIGGALHERTWGLVFPFIGLLAIYFLFLSLRLRPQALPFAMTARHAGQCGNLDRVKGVQSSPRRRADHTQRDDDANKHEQESAIHINLPDGFWREQPPASAVESAVSKPAQ